MLFKRENLHSDVGGGVVLSVREKPSCKMQFRESVTFR